LLRLRLDLSAMRVLRTRLNLWPRYRKCMFQHRFHLLLIALTTSRSAALKQQNGLVIASSTPTLPTVLAMWLAHKLTLYNNLTRRLSFCHLASAYNSQSRSQSYVRLRVYAGPQPHISCRPECEHLWVLSFTSVGRIPDGHSARGHGCCSRFVADRARRPAQQSSEVLGGPR
jgi:hypothetical protein